MTPWWSTSAGEQETLRLIGVDTPETVDPDQPPECFGAEASAHTKELLPAGTEVRLTRDVEARDRYDRLLVYVERAEDGLFVNLDLVAGGWADDYPYPPNVAHQRDFALAVSRGPRRGPRPLGHLRQRRHADGLNRRVTQFTRSCVDRKLAQTAIISRLQRDRDHRAP